MIEWFSLTCSMARLGFEAQNAAAFRLLRAATGASKTISDGIIREEMTLIPEKSQVAITPTSEESSVAIAPKRRAAASKMTHQKSPPVKRGKR